VVTSSQEVIGRLPSLDGVRGIAVALVVAYHLDLPSTDGAGIAGVSLFFVLSGFLITHLLLHEVRSRGRVDLKAFGRRRLLRIGPALTVVSAVVVLNNAVQGRAGRGLLDVLLVMTGTGNVAQAYGRDLLQLEHTWTVSVELQFYVLVAVVFAVAAGPVRRLPPRVLTGVALGAAVVVAIVRHAMEPELAVMYYATWFRLDALLLGCAAGCAGPRVAPRVGWLLVAIGGAGLAVVAGWCVFSPPRSLSVVLAGGAVAGALVVAGAAGMRTGVLKAAPLRRLGTISYGVYLWHYPIITALDGPMHERLSAPVVWVILVLSSVAAGDVSYRLVESHFLRRKTPGTVSGSAWVQPAAP
jgi:peptidoglycan/LPS O-acetylase OafA/YrhL